MTSFATPLRGIVPPLPTPLLDPDHLDVESLGRIVEHVIAGGVAGVFVLGSTGEGPMLPPKVQRELIQHTCRFAKGRVPVFVGITHPVLTESIALARCAADCHADAVVSAGPFYFPLTPRELFGYVEQLTTAQPLPLLLYNMPGLTKVWFGGDVVERALDLARVIGMKDSSGDMLYFQKIMAMAGRRPDWTLLVGPETLTAEAVLMGAHGGVNGGAVLKPRLYVDLCAAALEKNVPRVLALHEQVVALATRIYALGGDAPAVTKALKCALSCMGLGRNVLSAPLQPFGPRETAILREHLIALGLAVL